MGKNTLFGPYQLRSRLHKGAVAEVFRAIDTRTGISCAIKRILPEVLEEEDFVQEFEDEARIASELDHPNIARVLDFGAIDGTYFIAYELVDGVDLNVLFENASMASQPLPLPFLLHVFARIGEGLAHAHLAEIVHRDVTPQNIAVSLSGDVKLIDFGIAQVEGKLSRTGAGVIKGKLGYLSPEQLRGDAVDPRTDVFSLGICMWELLTLKRLFSAPNEILVLDMVKHHVPEPPSAHRAEVAAELDRIVLKALAKKQDERYRSARQLTKDLEGFVGISGAIATRDDIALTMRRTFAAGDARRTTGSIMSLQETRMSDDNKSGSDLDIFEGLGKKSAGRTAAAPPPPPASASGPSAASPSPEMKKTLMGLPGPPPPPSQGSLPAVPPAPPSTNPDPSAAALRAERVPSAPPPAPPPPSGGRISALPPVPAPPGSGSMRVAAPSSPSSPPSPSRPPPPPGRGALPNLPAASPSQPSMAAASQSPSVTQKVPSQIPPPASTRPVLAATAEMPAAPPTSPKGGKLDMDWGDDEEATHVFDKESRDNQLAAPSGPESRRPEHASMDDILSSPRPSSVSPPPAAGTPPPPAPASLSGAFGHLGQPRESVNGSSGTPSSQFRSGPPPSQSLRSAPPPPPGSMRPYNPSTATAPIPPPPPPGQTTTVPMHMPPRQQPSQPPGSGQGGHGSAPPQQYGNSPSHHPGPHSQPPPPQHVSQHPQHVSQPPQHASQPPMPHMPPVNRAMEATAVVPRQSSSSAGLWVALLLGVVMAAGVAVFFLMPRTGTLVVNVTDPKGGAVDKLEVLVDGKKACESAPCIVRDVSSGVHEVKVVAPGFETLAPKAVMIESRKDSPPAEFTLTPAKTAGGTGLKVTGNPLQTGVRISVDGKEYGPLPQELHDLTPGEHKVKITGSERYAPFEKTIDVKQDELLDLGNVALGVLKGKATIQLGTPGAKVYLVSGTNRKEVPQFPIAIDFDPKEKWNLEAKMIGMDDYAQAISFDDGQAEKTIVVTLSPKGTTPAATTPAAVAQQGTQVTAAAPVAKAPTLAPPATPKEPATPPAAKTPAEASPGTPPVAAKEPAAKTPPAAAAGGEAFLNINSRPASTVLLDGKPLGPTPRVKVAVSPGTHTVLFVNAEESLKKSVSITVAAGETKAVSAKLRD